MLWEVGTGKYVVCAKRVIENERSVQNKDVSKLDRCGYEKLYDKAATAIWIVKSFIFIKI